MLKNVHPERIELPSPGPEPEILSIELRMQKRYKIYTTSAEMPLLQIAVHITSNSSNSPFFTLHFPLL